MAARDLDETLAHFSNRDAAAVRFVTSWTFVGDERVCRARTLDLSKEDARPVCDCGNYPDCACAGSQISAFLARNSKSLRRVVLPPRIYRLVPSTAWSAVPVRIRASARSHLLQRVRRSLKRPVRASLRLAREAGHAKFRLVLSRK
jgi:hypothetical protein